MKKLLLLLAVIAFASAVQINSNTTINSTETLNTFFDINMTVCVTDNASGNIYCARNQTFVINNTRYYNDTQYYNNTIYPNCSNYSNTTVNFTYASFGVPAFLQYACYSGEIVNAPLFPNTTNFVNNTVQVEVPQPIMLNLTLKPGERYGPFIDFNHSSYIDIQTTGTCDLPNETNVTQAQCANFIGEGVRTALASVQANQATPQPAATTGFLTLDSTDWGAIVAAVLLAIGAYLYRQNKMQGQGQPKQQ